MFKINSQLNTHKTSTSIDKWITDPEINKYLCSGFTVGNDVVWKVVDGFLDRLRMDNLPLVRTIGTNMANLLKLEDLKCPS